MDVTTNNQANEFPDYDNIMVEMDSSKESLESEDSKDIEDIRDSADSKDSEDSSAEQLRSSFITSNDNDVDFAMVCQVFESVRKIQSQRTCPYTGEICTQHLLNGHLRTIREILRMDAPTFRSLCAELKCRKFIKADKNSERYRLAADRFQHSTEIIHRHFKIMMRALCHIVVLIIQPPNPNVIPLEIQNNPKRYPWFKDCIGAIDGTHIAAHALATKRTTYCGSATDSRVLFDALTRLDVSFPLTPTGKYYLIDAGFTNMMGFLAPYRSERYHLDQFHGRCPNGYKELRDNACTRQAAPATPVAGNSNTEHEVMNEMYNKI
ncbi:hypothetical protein CsSME_00042939 [Camellia sinensis var. sinensis]